MPGRIAYHDAGHALMAFFAPWKSSSRNHRTGQRLLFKEDDPWAALASLVVHLLAHETLEGEQVGKWLG
jgi:hypothetical protein